MELTRIVFLFLILFVCVGLSLEQMRHSEDRLAKKSRRKRRGCKCVHRYMSDVNKLIDTKLKEFKDVYLLPKLNDKLDRGDSQRMRDALLRLSGDVAETKNALRILTSNLEGLMEELDENKKEYTKTSRQISRMGESMANLTQFVDTMEHRLNIQAVTDNDVMGDNSAVSPKVMPTRE